MQAPGSRSATSPHAHTTPWSPRWLVSFFYVVAGCAAIPVIAGVLLAPPRTTYTWLHATAPGDVGVYYSYVQQVRDGGWLLHDQFTSEPGQLGTFNGLWWLVGTLARLLGLTAEVAYHVARIALLPLLVFAFARVAGLAAEQRAQRLTLVLLFAGGLGAYLAPWFASAVYQGGGAGYRWPIDLWGVHTFSFLSALHSPHSVASWALLVLAAWGGFLALERGERRPLVVAVVATLLLSNFHPYPVPVAVLLPAAYTLLRRLLLGAWPAAPWVSLVLAAAALPGGYYHVWLLAQDPVVAARASQNITLIPPLGFVLIGFGLLVPLAAIRLWQRRHAYAPVEVWAMSWLIVVAGLVCLPTTLQSRFLQGVLVPMVVLAVPVALTSYDNLVRRWPKLNTLPGATWLLLAALFFASPLYAVARDVALTQQPPPGWYLSADTVATFAWIAEHTPADAVVLAPPNLWLFVPRYAQRTTYVGHPHETLDYAIKAANTQAFYAGRLADPAVWLRSAGITHAVVLLEPGQTLPAALGTEVARQGVVVVVAVAK